MRRFTLAAASRRERGRMRLCLMTWSTVVPVMRSGETGEDGEMGTTTDARRKRLTPQQREQCRQLALRGLSFVDIGQIVGCSGKTAAYWADRTPLMAPDAREPMGQPTAADTNTATDKNVARTSDENRDEGDTTDALASVLRALEALMNAGSPKAVVGRLGATRLADVALLQGGLAYLTNVLEALRTMQGAMRRG